MTQISTTDVVTGTTADPAVINNNFAAVRNSVNGNLDNANINASAAIAVSKLAPGTNGQVLTTSGGAAAWGSLATSSPTIGTALPGSPTDGDRYILVDSTSAPTYAWLFQYSSSISDSYKWLCCGGIPAISEIEASQGTTSTTYVALATAGPSVAIPRAGIYQVEISAQITNSQGGLANGYMSYDIGGTGALDADATIVNGGNSFSGGGFRAAVKTLTAVTLTAKYRSGAGSNTATFDNRVMRVMPLRVS